MYSKLKKMNIKNFKNIGLAEIDFTESPIIALKGNNDAGKSSVIDAFAVLAYNAYETNQKGFIRLGTNGFGVMVELDDGTTVTRIKKENANFYEVRHPDGRVWNTDRLPRGESLPEEVENVMGCTRESETKEFLHIRTYKDQMLFISTPNSVNYKVMYDALKVENISKAIKKGSIEANEIKAWLNNASIQRETLINTLNGIKVFDLEPVSNIKKRLESQMGNLRKLNRAVEIIAEIKAKEDALGAFGEVLKSGIAEISELHVNNIVNAGNIIAEIDRLSQFKSRYSEIDSLNAVDIRVMQLMESAIDIIDNIKSMQNTLNKYSGVQEVEEVSLSIIDKLHRVSEIMSGLEKLNTEASKYTEIDKQLEVIDVQLLDKISRCSALVTDNAEREKALEEYQKQIEEIKAELKTMGVQVVKCDNCGHDVVVEENA